MEKNVDGFWPIHWSALASTREGGWKDELQSKTSPHDVWECLFSKLNSPCVTLFYFKLHLFTNQIWENCHLCVFRWPFARAQLMTQLQLIPFSLCVTLCRWISAHITCSVSCNLKVHVIAQCTLILCASSSSLTQCKKKKTCLGQQLRLAQLTQNR